MIFTCTKDNLAQALSHVSGLAARQHHLPILAHVLIIANESGVSLLATNLEVAIRTTIRAKVEKTGSFTVPAKMLADYINLLPDDQVQFLLEGDELRVKCGRNNTKMKGMPAEEFPGMPEVEKSTEFVFEPQKLKDALEDVVVAVSKNEIRPELSGVCAQIGIERYAGLTVAATDSHRLAEKQIPLVGGSGHASCIIPARTVYEMIRLLGPAKGEGIKARLYMTQNQISMQVGDVEMTSRLIHGTYPDYAQIIPKTFVTSVAVPADHFVKAIKTASLFSTQGVNGVSFALKAKEKSVDISSVSAQAGEHSTGVEADIDGNDNSILLNYRYILDGVSHIDGHLFMGVNSPDAPCIFHKVGDDSYVYIVMPIRQ